MRGNLDPRPINLGEYYVANKSTVRATAAHFGVSKSTVWKDLTERLPNLSYSLYKEVAAQMETNLNERHIRGGKATRIKFKGGESHE